MSSKENVMPVPVVQMPDLIDAGDPDDFVSEVSLPKHADRLTSSGSLVDDLFGDGSTADLRHTENGNDDPFADVSFHVAEDKQHDDIFSGLTVDGKGAEKQIVDKDSGMVDLFSCNSDLLQEPETNPTDVHNLMGGLSLDSTVEGEKHPRSHGVPFMGDSFTDAFRQSSQIPVNQSSQMPAYGALNGGLGSNSFFPMAPMQYNMPPNMMLNPAFATQPLNYGAMGAFIAQQQLLYQNLGNLNTGYGHTVANSLDASQSSPLPDIFQLSNNPVQSHTAGLSNSKKEDTKAFDFISVSPSSFIQ